MADIRWHYLLIDNDNTLMDFDLAESRALTETLEAAGIPADEGTRALYHRINDAQWKALERGETTQERLKVERFRLLLEALDRREDPGEALALRYQENLSRHGELLPGAEEFLRAVRGKMRICLVSNGVSAIQRGRLACSGMEPLLDAVVISEEVGVPKPDPRVAEAALRALRCGDRRDAVLAGDSASADIACARAAGITGIYIGAKGAAPEADYTVESLRELRRFLLEEIE